MLLDLTSCRYADYWFAWRLSPGRIHCESGSGSATRKWTGGGSQRESSLNKNHSVACLLQSVYADLAEGCPILDDGENN
jgi:hypothetical protein